MQLFGRLAARVDFFLLDYNTQSSIHFLQGVTHNDEKFIYFSRDGKPFPHFG